MLTATVRGLWEPRGEPHGKLPAPSLVDVVYRESPAGRMDVYLPPPERRTGASVVLVHGGGFVIGSKGMTPLRFVASRLCAAGVVVAAPDYRLLFRGGGFDESLRDVRDAHAHFCQAWVPRLGLDPARVSFGGLSAGATLAYTAAAVTDGVHRLACVFGAYDLAELRGPSAALPRLLFRTADRSAWTARLPLGLARHPTAPTLLLHGSADALIPVKQAERLRARRDSAGLPTELVIFDGAPHGFFRVRCAWAEEGARRIVSFLDGHQ